MYQIFIVAYVMMKKKRRRRRRKKKKKKKIASHVGFEHTKIWNTKQRPYSLGYLHLFKVYKLLILTLTLYIYIANPNPI